MPLAKTVGRVGNVDLEECSKIAFALRQADFEVLEGNDYDGAYRKRFASPYGPRIETFSDTLRSAPRFQELLRGMNFPP